MSTLGHIILGIGTVTLLVAVFLHGFRFGKWYGRRHPEPDPPPGGARRCAQAALARAARREQGIGPR